MALKLKFFGGAQEVGRSAIMLEDGESKRRFMLDFGIKIDHIIDYPIDIPNIDAAILSHAHLDHSGFVPALYNDQKIPCFGTPPTFELSILLIKDSLKIEKRRHLKSNFHNKQINEFKNKFIPLNYNKTIPFGNYDITFYDAGHISGSAITKIQKQVGSDKRIIVYTGDFKLQSQMMHNGAEIIKSDILIIESTYANREHENREALIKKFIEEIKETLANKGTVLIPAFAVGRSQEILTILYKNNLIESTYFDGMGKDAAGIVLKYPDYINNAELLKKAMDHVNIIDNVMDKKEALQNPSIIVTTSGMLSGGPVLYYITRLNKNSHILLTGYQTEKTNGRTLLENGYIIIDNSKIKIPQKVSFYDFSAHAGKSDLFDYAKRSEPQIIICVHGDENNTQLFADELKDLGYISYAPKIGESINL
ncbi:MAG: MBL fold metallo-hydrolase [Candidatus Micrarchaeia archaeon]